MGHVLHGRTRQVTRLPLILLLAALPAAAQKPEASGAASCPAALEAGGLRITAPITCACGPNMVQQGRVRGSFVYSGDSAICRAARHAGAVGVNGGMVIVVPGAGRDSYPGTARNGVASEAGGRGGASFAFAAAPAGAPPGACPARYAEVVGRSLTCRCDAAAVQAGSVYGTDLYTADSTPCRAARHAGVIPPEGGTVTLTPEEGRRVYAPSSRNGVVSLPWGPQGTSFSVGAGP